jgi:hypothetical protein
LSITAHANQLLYHFSSCTRNTVSLLLYHCIWRFVTIISSRSHCSVTD